MDHQRWVNTHKLYKTSDICLSTAEDISRTELGQQSGVQILHALTCLHYQVEGGKSNRTDL